MGIAIKESGIPREGLFVTTKVYSGVSDVVLALKRSLERLKLEYVDLFLVHSPFLPAEANGLPLATVWKAMEDVYQLGLAKAIGVSNFQISHLQEILSVAKVPPSVNQIEFNPYLQQPELVEFSKNNGLLLEAYAPLISLTKKVGGPLDPVVSKIAKRKGRSSSQVLLRWVIQNGVLPLTTSGKAERQAELLQALNFELSAEEVTEISAAGKTLHHRQYWTNFLP